MGPPADQRPATVQPVRLCTVTPIPDGRPGRRWRREPSTVVRRYALVEFFCGGIPILLVDANGSEMPRRITDREEPAGRASRDRNGGGLPGLRRPLVRLVFCLCRGTTMPR